ncbi:MAG: flagellar protein FlaG [bacterium]|nr:flagellar protein FlaG [bacterium]
MGTIQHIQEGLAPRPGARGGAPARDPAPAAPEPVTVQEAAAPIIDPDAAREFARQVQQELDRMAPATHEIAFRRDESTNGFVIEVRNPDGSVVRQYPPEKLLNLRRRLDEMSGMVIDEMT